MGRKKILVIDDETEFGQLIKMNLELLDDDYEVIYTPSGKEGLKIAASEKPDLVLLDVMMPKIDGLEVLKKLKADEKTMQIPVVMLTAKVDDETKMKANALYNDDYLTKPIGAPELKEKIQQVFKRHGKL